MDAKTLASVLSKASESGTGSKNRTPPNKSDLYEFDTQQKAALLVAVGGDAVTLAPVRSVALETGFAVVQVGKSERVFVAIEQIAAVTITETDEASAGFKALG